MAVAGAGGGLRASDGLVTPVAGAVGGRHVRSP
nr:MAG TPA: hypothetical protein [Caudoviricetes sp.]